MNCCACGHDNPERAKFCLECGTPIAARCASCGTELPPAAKFCLECGARTAAAPAAPSPPASPRDAGARKVVTILFADLAGSTALQERLDAESTSLFMQRYYAAMRAAVEAHGGTVVKLLGDGVMVAFGVPRVAEDDALRAVRAGVAMQQAFRVLAGDALAADTGIGLRIAVNTGEVVVNADHSDVVGDPVNVAARLQQEAGDGEVVLGEATQRLVASLVTIEPIGSVALKGRSEAVQAYRVVSLERPQGAAATAFVGRDGELARLTAVYDRAVATPASALVVLLGSPGLGKSRLIDEFARRQGAAATVVTAQCDAAGGATFAPLVQALRALLAIEDGAAADAVRTAIEGALPGDVGERGRIAGGISALLTGSPASPEETFFAVRRFLAGVAQARPVVLVIDDLHWAEPLLLDLVEHLVQWGAGVPLLVLVGARPELHTLRSTLVTPGGLVADVVTLTGLDAGAAMRLAANVIGAADLPAAVAAKVLATSEGNPLFVGELVRMLVQEGALTKEGERWTIGAGLAALEMPPTIHALLAARIERLRPDERSVLERAAVVGRHFSRSAVAALLPRDAADLDAALESLRRSELIERDTGWLLGEPVLRFHHVLIRDAAYRRLLKGTRAELHGRLADWIEAQVGEAAEYDETIGRHLEQAHQHLSELGPLDAQGRSLGERASQRLAAAGRRALASDDLPLAAGLLGRAIAGLDEADPVRADLALDWCEALLAAGDVGPAAQAIDELGRHVEGAAPAAPDELEGAAPSAPVASGNDAPIQPALEGAASSAPVASGNGDPIQPALEGAASSAPVASGNDAPIQPALEGAASSAPVASGNDAPIQPALEGAASSAPVASGNGDPNQQAPTKRRPPVAGVERASGAPIQQAPTERRPPGDARRQRLAAWRTCFTGQLTVLTAPEALQATADAVAAAAAEFAALGDAAGEAKAHQVHAQTLARLGRVGACEAALDRALAAARKAGDRRRANAVLAGAPLAALWGPSPVTRASGRCLDVVRVLRITQGAPAVEAVALSCQGILEALRGRTDAARRMIASSRKMVEELGITHRLFEADAFVGRIELLEGDAVAAERSLRGAYEGLRDLGLAIDAAQAAALLGRALLAQQRGDEAEALSRESEALAGDDLQAAIAWRGVRAEALAQRGEHAAAVELAQAAVTIAAATDALLDHADARLALAAVLRAAGRAGEAEAEKRRAIELWEAKGATLLAERVRADKARLAPRATPRIEQSARPRVEPARSVQRRVAANAATVAAAEFDAAFASRSIAAIESAFVHSAGVHVFDHPTESTYGREEAVESFRRLLRCKDPVVRHQPLATLGESLGLFRRHIASGGSIGGSFDVAAFEREEFVVTEPGVLIEIFAGDRLGDAIARLYARYAELLPEGSDRQRAAVTARAVTYSVTDSTTPDVSLLFDPRYEDIDHRNVGYGTLSTEEARKLVDSQRALADNLRFRVEDVLALRPDGLVRKTTTSGVWRAGGGAFERTVCLLSLFGADGRATRQETFDGDREAETLARFDELAAASAQPNVARRVRPNVAAAAMTRFAAAFAARDVEALDAAFAPSLAVIDHPNGASYACAEEIASVRRLRRSPETDWRHTTLACLGDSLSLDRRAIAGRGSVGSRYDVGDYAVDHLTLSEVDGRGRFERIEVFATDHLGDAIVRLYQRYAELLPEGPACARAASSARSIELMFLGLVNREGVANPFSPDVVWVDHRVAGVGTLHGDAAVLAAVDAFLSLVRDASWRFDDVLACSADALLTRTTNLGTDRETGGAFERQILWLIAFAADGSVACWETWDDDRVDEALARFAALTSEAAAPPVRRVRPNAATAVIARMEAAFAARDLDAVDALLGEAMESVDHQTGTAYGREGHLDSSRRMMRLPGLAFRLEVLATLGDRLCLLRRRVSASGTAGGHFDVAEYEMEHVGVLELDANGRCRSFETFASDHFDAAVVRFYERYAESLPAGPVRERAAATARSLATFDGLVDPYGWASTLAPDIEQVDHRILSTWSARGQAAVLAHLRSLQEVAGDSTVQSDDVLAASPNLLLHRGTHTGTDLRGGGRYERAYLCLTAMASDGRVARVEFFDADRAAEALARFDELVGRRPPVEANRFVANAATPFRERINAAWSARDWVGLAELLASDYRFSDRRRLVQVELDREEWVDMSRRLGAMSSARVETEELATRGNRLALWRVRIDVADDDVGPSCVEHLNLHEVNAAGDRLIGGARFDVDDLDAAYAELGARYEAGEGAAYPAHAVVMRAFAAAVASRDWDPVVALCAPTFVEHDHRALAVLGTTRGAAAWAQNFRTLTDLAPDTVYRVDHFRSAARGFCSVGTWHGTRDGGHYEIPLIAVIELDARDRLVRADIYDLDQVDQARARFAELEAPSAPPVPSSPRSGRIEGFANAATASAEPVIRCMIAHDWDGFAQPFTADFRMSDRRRVVQLELDRDQYVAFTREVSDGRAIRNRWELVATRGERLAVIRAFYEFADTDVGPSEIAFLLLMEVDARGRIVANVRWDVDDLAAAYAELDARWQAGEAAAYPFAAKWLADYLRCFAARDWTAMTALFAPDLVGENHRLVGWGTRHGPAGIVSTLQAQIELAPDTQERVDHVRICRSAVLFEYAWCGTREGGAFENLWLVLVELDAAGRACRADVWEAEQLEQAQARFAEIAASATTPSIPSSPRSGRIEGFANAATRAVDRGTAALAARDWEGFAALMAAGFRHYDRTRVAQIETDGRQWLASFRQMVEMTSSRPTQQLVATRGERLALLRVLWRGAEGDIGPSEIDWLLIVEVDGRGDHLAVVAFDPDDLAAAYAELDSRWAAGEGGESAVAGGGMMAAIARRDWEAFPRYFAADVRICDHRLLGWGTTLEGLPAFIQAQQVLVALAPDAHNRVDHQRHAGRAELSQAVQVGTRDGGPFETPVLIVAEANAQGLVERFDVYDPSQMDEAWARFDALSIGAPADPPAAIAQGNAATAVVDRWQLLAGDDDADWQALRATCAPGLVFEDRQGFARLTGDRDLMIASLRERAANGTPERWLLGTAGERVALTRMLWSGGPAGGRFEIEYIALTEVEASGLVIASILFAADDARGAQREAWARWAAIDPAAGVVTAVYGAMLDAANERDPARYRALFADALVIEDHRHGVRIEGLEAYAEQVALLWQHAPDSRIDGGWFWPAVARHGAVTVTRRSGALADEFLWLFTVERGRIARIEVFALEDVDAAVARLAELRPEPLRIPPNAASRASDRHWALAWAGKWDAVQTLHAPSLVFDDRREGLRTTTDGAAYLAGLRWGVGDRRVQATRTLLATAGDRLDLRHNRFTRTEEGVLVFEIDTLAVTEIDAESRLVAIVLFDPADRVAASTELFERYAASSAGGIAQRAIEVARAWNDHDLERLRALLPDDFYLDDRRRTGVGRVEGVDAYIDSLAAMHELSRDLRLDVLYYVTVAAHGRVYVARWSGTNLEGGEFDAVYVCLGLARADRLVGLEIFELEDFDAALARFETLRPDIATTSA